MRLLILICALLFQKVLSDGEDTSEVIRKLVFTKCKKVEDKKEEMINCIKNGLDDIQEAVKNGAPEFSLPPLDPFAMEEIIFEEDNGSQVKVRAVMQNLRLYGISDYEVTHLNVDYDRMSVRLGVMLPRIRVTGHYSLKGEVFVLPITGNGTFWLTAEEAQVYLVSKLIARDNQLLFDFNGFDFTYENVAVRFNNLFNGDQLLGEVMNTFFNSNAGEIIKEVKPVASKVLFQIANKLANGISQSVGLVNFPGYKHMKLN